MCKMSKCQTVWWLRGMWLLQMRYAAGTKDVLDRFFNNKPLKKDDVIVEVSHLSLPAYALVLYAHVLCGIIIHCLQVQAQGKLVCLLGQVVAVLRFQN